LVANDGEVLSSSFISSASAEAGLSAALSGDVVLPASPQLSEELVMLDRYPASVLTFASVETATVRAQLDVSTGFASNPQDYLWLTPKRAFVTRYERNTDPGLEPFDGGSDVLIVDPSQPAIIERIDLVAAMADAPEFLPRPGPMIAHEGYVHVLLSAYAPDFSSSGASRIATVEAESGAVLAVTVLDGLHGCSGLARSPLVDAQGVSQPLMLAVSCSGGFDGSAQALAQSGVVVLDVGTAGELSERERFDTAAEVGQLAGFSLAFADRDRLLVVLLGEIGSGAGADTSDVLVQIDRTSGALSEVLRSAGSPFQLGDVSCAHRYDEREAADCGACFVADAEASILVQLDPTSDPVAVLDGGIVVDDEIGLSPRLLGRF